MEPNTRKSFSLVFFFLSVLSGFQKEPNAPFGTRKVLRKEKNTRENDFVVFGFTVENIKENQI